MWQPTILIITAILFGQSQPAFAQSMQVLGGNSFARECFQLSSSAALTGLADQRDVAICDKAISHGSLKKKDLVATYVNRGVLKVAVEDYRAAVQDYNLAIKLSEDTPEAYVNRGNLWFMSERFVEAIADYDRSLQLNLSQAHVALLNKGMALESLGRWGEAREQYLLALARVAEWPLAKQKLLRVEEKLRRSQPIKSPE